MKGEAAVPVPVPVPQASARKCTVLSFGIEIPVHVAKSPWFLNDSTQQDGNAPFPSNTLHSTVVCEYQKHQHLIRHVLTPSLHDPIWASGVISSRWNSFPRTIHLKKRRRRPERGIWGREPLSMEHDISLSNPPSYLPTYHPSSRPPDVRADTLFYGTTLATTPPNRVPPIQCPPVRERGEKELREASKWLPTCWFRSTSTVIT